MLLVKRDRVETVLAPGVREPAPAGRIDVSELNSEIAILLGPAVIQRVAQELMSGETGGPAAEEGERRAELERELQQRLRAEQVERSNLIELSFRARDPKRAAEALRVWTQVYLERRAELIRSSETAGFYQEQVAAAGSALGRAEQEMQAALAARRLTMVGNVETGGGIGVQQRSTFERLTALERELSEAHVSLRERESEIAALSDQLREEPARVASPDRSRRIAATEELELQLVRLRAQRDEAVQKYTADSQPVRRLDAQIALADERQRTLAADQSGLDGTERNIVHDSLRTRLAHARAEHESLLARQRALQTELATVRAASLRLGGDGLALDSYSRSVLAARERFALLVRRLEEARVAEAMDRSRLVNVTVVEPALEPAQPVLPRRRLNLVLGVLLGTMCGGGLVAVRHLLDRTVNEPRQLAELGARFLGSVPEQS